MKEVDILIIGAGSAGATLAWKASSLGLDVGLVDARERGRTGASWRNAVEATLFDQIGLARPQPPLAPEGYKVAHIETTAGGRLTCSNIPIYDVDMSRLVAILVERAERAGAQIEYGTRFIAPLLERDAVVGASFKTKNGTESVRAGLTVDAAGMSGSLRRHLPGALWDQDPLVGKDVCTATQQNYSIADERAAREYLEKNRLQSGETLSLVSILEGFSVLDVMVDLERGHVDCLSGVMLSRGRNVPSELIERRVAQLGFVGKKISGGSGLIPVRRAVDRLVGNGFALIGDAAFQVFPAHGSGVACGMLAAELLAKTAARAMSSGPATTETLWPYAVAYQQGRGALCAAHESVRRFSETVKSGDLNDLFSVGALDSDSAIRTIACEHLQFKPHQVFAGARLLPRSMGLVRRLSTTGARAGLVRRHYERFPRLFQTRSFRRWRRIRSVLFR